MPIPVQIHVREYPALKEPAHPVLESTEGFLIDISEFGMGLTAQAPMPWGTLVDIEFPRAALPVAARRHLEGLMHIIGRVVHAIPQGNQYRLGLSFIRVDDIDRSLIQQLTSGPERRRAPRISLAQTATKQS